MKLKKLTGENITKILNNKIFLVAYFAEYIKEMYDKYPMLPFLSGAFDCDPRKLGKKDFEGHSFEVMSYEKINLLEKDAILIITTGYYMEEYEKLCEMDLPESIGDTIFYFANKDSEFYEYYLDKFKNITLKNLIVFRSGMGTWEYVPGMDFTENSRALFEYMLSMGYNKKYEMVWLVKYPEKYCHITNKYENVKFVSYDWAILEDEKKREEYYQAICLAKFFFFTHACGFCRLPRQGQIRVQLWHGCGLKKSRNTISQKKRYEFMTVISKLYAEIHEKEFGLKSDQLLVTGYAKGDWLFHPAENWKKKLEIPDGKKVLVWLPTFRTARATVSYMSVVEKNTATGLPIVDTERKMEEISKELAKNNAILIIKMHPLQNKESVAIGNHSNVKLIENEKLSEADLHINQVLGDADALISDYSSAAIDFLLLDKPLAFTLDDVQEYEESRGFAFNPIKDWLPGEMLYTFEDFIRFIHAVLNGNDSSREQRRSLAKKFHDFHDDRSCERILRELNV